MANDMATDDGTMGERNETPNLGDLLAHADWVRGLARELVRDEHRAEDVVQETWIAAMRRGPRDSTNLRAWLATVVRNVARGLGRAEGRRVVHEREGARHEGLPPDHEVTERVRVQHELVERVLSLDEPYRAVLLLRYFEGLPPRAIAARLRIPVATVRTRHARGLQRLRERLTRERDADEWRRELSAVAWASSSVHSAAIGWTGGVWMGVQAKAWTTAAIVLLALGGIWWSTTRPSAESAPAVDVGAALASSAASTVTEVGTTAPQRSVVPMDAPKADTKSTTSDAVPKSVPACVVDTHGRPVPNARLVRLTTLGPAWGAPMTPEAVERFLRDRWAADSMPAVHGRQVLALLDDPASYLAVDAQGRFEAPVESNIRPAVVVWSRGWVNIANGWRTTALGTEEYVVVVERSVTVTGNVVDDRGDPIPYSSVTPIVSLRAVTTFPDTLQRIGEHTAFGGALTDDAGRFELVGVPLVEGLGLGAQATGFVRRIVSPPVVDLVGSLSIVLHRSVPTKEVDITGRVVGGRNEPIPDAHVFFGSMGTLTDESGAFRIHVDREMQMILSSEEQAKATRVRFDLVASRKGLQPAILEDFGPQLDDAEACSGLVLRLDAPTLSISGHVVDSEGKPRADVEIVLVDPTVLGTSSSTAEDESSRVAVAKPFGRRFVTDAAGAFEVDGLRARDYRLLAIDLDRCVAVESEPVPAGTKDVELRQPDTPCWEHVRGQVLSSTGRPLRGVDVGVHFRVVRSNGLVFQRDGPSTHTDTDGFFELERVPKERAALVVSGTNVDVETIDVGGYEPGRVWIVKVHAKARFRLELSDSRGIRTVGVLDAEGSPMQIVSTRANAYSLFDRVPLSRALDSVCTTDDRATTLVLYGDAGEIRRVPIRLSADELTVIRP